MKRFLLILLVLLLLAIGAVIVLPFFFKDDIVSAIKNDSINGRIEFDENIELSVIQAFPDVSLTIRNLAIINNAPFEGDTLLSLNSVSATIDLFKIIAGEIEIKSIRVHEPRVKVLVTKDEVANYDIALDSDDETVEDTSSTSEFSLRLSELTVTDGYIMYSDTSLATHTVLQGFNFKMSGDFNEKKMAIESKTTVAAWDLFFDDIHYVNRATIDYDAGLDLYLSEEKYVFRENHFSLNELKMALDGSFQFVDEDYKFDLSYALENSEFKDLLSLVPAIYSQDFEGLKSSGSLAFNGYLKGLMTETLYPEFEFNLGVKDGSFAYPEMPAQLNNTQVNLQLKNPGGVFDKTVVNLSQFHIELNEEPFDAKAMARNLDTEMYVDAGFKGSIDLGRVAKLVPLEDVNELAGLVSTNLEVKGNLSDLEKEQYEKFYATGNLLLSEFAFAGEALADRVAIPSAKFSFNPEYAAIEDFSLIMGKSDLQFNGKVSNYLPYVLRDDTLRGKLTLRSENLDLNPWMEDEDVESSPEISDGEDDYELEVVKIPENLNLTFSSSIGKVHFENYDLRSFNGKVQVKNSILSLREVQLSTMGGEMLVNGNYNTQNIAEPKSAFSFEMKDILISEMYSTFMTVQKLLPIAKQMDGRINYGTFQISNTMGQDFMPIYETVNGKAKLKIDKVSLEGNKVWDLATDYLKWGDEADRLVLYNIKPSFEIVNGEVSVDTFDFKVKNQSFDFGGKSGLDQSLNYALDTEMPLGNLSQKAEGLISDLTKNKINVDLQDKVNLRMAIGGTVTEPMLVPKILGKDGNSMSLKDQAKEKLDEVKEQAKEEAIEKTKEELRKQAAALKAQAAELRKRAQLAKQEAAKLRKKGEALKAESEKLRKEADAQKKKIEKEMSALPEFAREKAMKPVDALFSQADNKLDEANKYFDLAKKPENQVDKLLKRADELEKKADDMLKD